MDGPLPMPRPMPTDSRSRTPSPDRFSFPRISASPGRASSPLGQTTLAKTRGPRPLPNPFSRGQNASSQSLSSGLRDNGTEPSRSGTGSANEHHTQPTDPDNEDAPAPARPSRKALGKRRVIEDPDSELSFDAPPQFLIDVQDKFDPDDMFGAPAKESSASSEESITADDVFFAKPVKYAYDAYQEKLDNEVAEQRSRAQSRASTGRILDGVGSSAPSPTTVEAR